MDDTWGLEVIIELCRLQIQREREKLAMSTLTPNMRGALESMKKLRHYADTEAGKLINRIETEAMPHVKEGFAVANASIDEHKAGVTDIVEFTNELKGSNGSPLDDGGKSSSEESPRSSEVASK